MRINVSTFGLLSTMAFSAACSAPEATSAPEPEIGSSEEALSLGASDRFYVARGRCGARGAGVDGELANTGTSASCLAPIELASGADTATADAFPVLGEPADNALFRVDALSIGKTQVRQIFFPAGTLTWPLAQEVERLRFFQVSASSCADGAIFTAVPLNDPGFLLANAQRGWGVGDVRVNFALNTPPGWDDARLQHEVLFEQAAFRGTVERPTFDILHPFAERPLLITVFEILPLTRSANRCP